MSETKTEKDVWGDDDSDSLDSQIAGWDNDQIKTRTRMLENNIRIMKSETRRLAMEQKAVDDKIAENNEKIKMNKQLPYLVANVVEVSSPCRQSSYHSAQCSFNMPPRYKCCV